MERDAIKFLITTATKNYPNFVTKILAYKMPWVMWTVVRPMLPRRTVEMIKFVNSHSIKEYVALDQLLTPGEVKKQHCFAL